VLVDLHVHYGMQLVPDKRPGGRNPLLSADGRSAFGARFDARVIRLAARLWNDESLVSGPRVSLERMGDGDVRVALSVLTCPLLEFGSRLRRPYRLRPPYGAPPVDSYFPALLRQLELVERDIAERHAGEAVVARNPDELTAGLAGRKLVLVHCVEGGFHLGASAAGVDRAVSELARRGVAYITVAHLFWRHVATNAPALGALPDRVYMRIAPQPAVGLGELGRAAVIAMVREGVLIDVTHMSRRALDDTFDLLDELDPDRSTPVIASHTAYRFGARAYNLDDTAVRRIAARDGIIGLILSEVFVADGLRREPSRRLDDSVALLCAHVDRIHEITGSHRHVALGSDLDGFIKPTLAGLEHPGRLRHLEEALVERYGSDVAAQITSDNALRLLRSHWLSPRRERPSLSPGA
jgi:microsomal dipeptidase-like Zn-dependent dipeptidase